MSAVPAPGSQEEGTLGNARGTGEKPNSNVTLGDAVSDALEAAEAALAGLLALFYGTVEEASLGASARQLRYLGLNHWLSVQRASNRYWVTVAAVLSWWSSMRASVLMVLIVARVPGTSVDFVGTG